MTPEWFTPPLEELNDMPWQFKIRPLAKMESLDIASDTYIRGDGELAVGGNGSRTALRKGVISMRQGEDGEEVKPSIGMEQVSGLALQQVAVEIINRTDLTGEQAKNSQSQLKSS